MEATAMEGRRWFQSWGQAGGTGEGELEGCELARPSAKEQAWGRGVVALEEGKAGNSVLTGRETHAQGPAHGKGAVGGRMQSTNRPVKQILAECNR